MFRITGVAHLVSISGLHITLFAWLAAAVIGAGWRRSAWLCTRVSAPAASMLGGLLLASAYAIFSGWGVPAQRTIFMLATVTLLRLSGRRWPWPLVWLLACTLVLLADPWAMLQAGFWLSFVAVGILFATDARAQQQDAQAVRGLAALLHKAKAMMREQWVVMTALTPLTLLLFGQMSIVGFIANLLAIPWVTLVVTPIAFAGVLIAPLWHVAAWTVRVMNAVLHWFATWPFAQLNLPAAPWWAAAFAVLGGLVLAMRWPWQVRLLALPLILPALWWSPARPAEGAFDLLAVDVGQGQAVLIRTRGHSLLYDAGPRYSPDSNAGDRVLVPLLLALGERLDMLVLSHRDSDHTGGASAVLKQQPQAQLLASIEQDHPLQALRAIQPCYAGQSWVWDGVQFEVLHPLEEDAQQVMHGKSRAIKSNWVSCVVQITSRNGAVALLTGDIEQPQERQLLARNALKPVDLLLAPHHGSKTSSSAAFLDRLMPRFAVVQSGYRNRFGHPATVVAARYRERQIELVQTPNCGAFLWRSDERDTMQCERELGRRYWHWGRYQDLTIDNW